MKKNKAIALLIISVLLLLLGFVFLYPEKFGFCAVDDRDCIYPNAFNFGEPLIFTMPAIILLSVILFFTKPEVFKAWSKFAMLVIPLLALLIIFTPVQCGGGYVGLCLDKEMASIFSGVGFFIVSLVLIIYKSLKPRSQNNLTV